MRALKFVKCLFAASIIGLSGAASAAAQAAKDVTFVIANPSAVNIIPVAVAMGEGYFAEAGLNVKVEALNGSGAVLQALTAGQGQIGNPAAGPFLGARARGIDITFIYRLNPNSSLSMVVKEEAATQKPEELKGKVIGIGTADGAEASFARSVFGDLGMEEGKDYSFLVVGDGGLATAGFMRGDIDAYVAATSDAAILNSRGLKLRNITPEKFRVFFGNGFAAMADYIEKNPDVIEGFGKAVVKGAHFATDPANIDKVIDHAAAVNPQEGEDRDFSKALIEQIVVRQTPFDLAKGYGYQDLEAWQAWQESLVSSGELKAPLPDLEAIYTNRFVEAWNAK
ncbi:ABC transporter substrate-binding protein [Rhizobium sp. Root73]|uniref:ABC transporter substrate-binding protein n=1 Tax=unclassified Rhizobium TaxID=2613769 RepID=UPI0007259112|nr:MULTISPECIES: ABC transporter substrate-binding protein [unclassified Rhizobium]KQY16760.1 ABC transporter substrate-binding protein [Rhizobium sp. Root1334]KRC11322.1 ABC transporter substrate-binding protein [Rhizobium sp. Root73]